MNSVGSPPAFSASDDGSLFGQCLQFSLDRLLADIPYDGRNILYIGGSLGTQYGKYGFTAIGHFFRQLSFILSFILSRLNTSTRRVCQCRAGSAGMRCVEWCMGGWAAKERAMSFGSKFLGKLGK